MGRPKQTDARDTRQEVLGAALELFAEKGYFGTSLRDIARAVGVRESALYHYFTSKEALFEELVFERRPEWLLRIEGLLDEPTTDVRALLEQVASVILEHFATLRQRKLFRILMSDGLRLARAGRINFFDRAAPGHDFLPRLMDKLVREGWLRPADPDMLAMEFFAALLLSRQLHEVMPGLPLLADAGAFARRHVEHFLRGASEPTPT